MADQTKKEMAKLLEQLKKVGSRDVVAVVGHNVAVSSHCQCGNPGQCNCAHCNCNG